MRTHAISLSTMPVNDRNRYYGYGQVFAWWLVSSFKNRCEGCGFDRWFLTGRFTRLK